MQTDLLPVDAIDPNPDQPRKNFNPELLAELANSIARSGLLQPITVRRKPDGRYIIVAGERRWRAHVQLAKGGRLEPPVIPAMIREMSDADMAIAAIVENLQRADISPLEEADAFARLVAEGMTAEDIAERTGAAAFRVRWRLTLLNLAPEIRKLFETDNLDRQQALELARLPEHRDQHRVLRLIQRGALTGWKAVRQAVDGILENVTQADIFGDASPVASEADVSTMKSMERRIARVAEMIGAGWKDGECVVASKVNPGNANLMADQLNAIQKALRIMERELRNTTAQATLLEDA